MDINKERYKYRRNRPYNESFYRIKIYKEIKSKIDLFMVEVEKNYIESEIGKFYAITTFPSKYREFSDVIYNYTVKRIKEKGIRVSSIEINDYAHFQLTLKDGGRVDVH